MAKADLSRDYYADLELPPTADIADIKKQFRKLALIYHPDRNPGKEAEVNAKFQTIQSAHEVLTNPEQKTRFDAHRARNNRYPAASGVKGNPWQNVASQYPPPPKRPPMNSRSSATGGGASRYSSWVPPQKSSRDNFNDNAKAWDRMRPASSGRAAPTSGTATPPQPPPRKPQPPPVPPRTESQRKKAEASFGNRRTTSAAYQDEPASRSYNYSSGDRPTSASNEAAFGAGAAKKHPRPKSDYLDPLSAQFREASLDARQSTPYSRTGGEKTNPFDGTNLGRSRSGRDRFDGPHSAGNGTFSPETHDRRRSNSVPDETQYARHSATARSETGSSSGSQTSRSGSRAGERKSGAGVRNSKHAKAPFTAPNSSSSSVNSAPHPTTAPGTASKSKEGSSAYAQPFIAPTIATAKVAPLNAKTPHSNGCADAGKNEGEQLNLSPEMLELLARVSPSGDVKDTARKHLNAFERKQYEQLQHLINTRKMCEQSAAASQETTLRGEKHADKMRNTSFTFGVGDDTFSQTRANLTRNSTDNINMRFAAEDFADGDWQFNAGGPSEDAFIAAKRMHRSRTHQGRQSPAKKGSQVRYEATTEPRAAEAEQKPPAFDPDEWKFAPHDFVPPAVPASTASPTRQARTLKKTKPVRMTAGTAGLVVDEEESSGGERIQPGTSASHLNETLATGSPNAMDIDTPPPEPTLPRPSAARNIPVEPFRHDWRAGVVKDVNGENKTADTQAPLNVNARGSEDTDELLHSNLFANFKSVPPFAPQPGGLGSLSDLASTLPFESKPSANILPDRQDRDASKMQLNIPSPPVLPSVPVVLATSNQKASPELWKKYVLDVQAYMEKWTTWNGRMVDHFAARRRVVADKAKKTHFNWIESRGDADLVDYIRGLEEDKVVRQKWTAAYAEHEMVLRDLVKYRARMME